MICLGWILMHNFRVSFAQVLCAASGRLSRSVGRPTYPASPTTSTLQPHAAEAQTSVARSGQNEIAFAILPLAGSTKTAMIPVASASAAAVGSSTVSPKDGELTPVSMTTHIGRSLKSVPAFVTRWSETEAIWSSFNQLKEAAAFLAARSAVIAGS